MGDIRPNPAPPFLQELTSITGTARVLGNSLSGSLSLTIIDVCSRVSSRAWTFSEALQSAAPFFTGDKSLINVSYPVFKPVKCNYWKLRREILTNIALVAPHADGAVSSTSLAT